MQSNCIDWGSQAFNKVYSGLDCQAVAHNADLPYTGLNLTFICLVGILLLVCGVYLYTRNYTYEDVYRDG